MPKINKFDIETSIRPIRSLRSGAVCRALSESETSRLRIERGNRNGVWHMILQTRVCGVFVFIVYLIYGFYSIKWKQYCICIRLRVCFRGRSLMFWCCAITHPVRTWDTVQHPASWCTLISATSFTATAYLGKVEYLFGSRTKRHPSWFYFHIFMAYGGCTCVSYCFSALPVCVQGSGRGVGRRERQQQI
jgi:hypothetical protein